MATIINLILKGSALLNRLRDRQAANRKAQLEQERQRKDAAKARQARQAAIPQRSQVATFARRQEEPAATPTGAPLTLVITAVFTHRPKWAFPNNASTYSDATEKLNAAQEPATGKLTTVTAPPFTLESWQSFDARAPQTGGVYQRIYRPYTAIHDRGVSFSFGYTYAVLPSVLTTTGTDVATLAAPQFRELRTDPIAQEFPYMVYPYVIGPRGFAVAYDGPSTILQVFTQSSVQDSNDKPGCAVLYEVNDQVRIVPFLIYSTSESARVANDFMRSYFTNPDRLYTISAVDRSVAGQVRYTISDPNWPALMVEGLRFYLIKPYATWDQVPADRVRWAYDASGIPEPDLPDNLLSDEYYLMGSYFDYQKPYKKIAYTASIYEHPLYSMENPAIQRGPTGLNAVWPSLQSLIDGQDNAYSFYRQKFSSASRRVIASEAGTDSYDDIIADDEAWGDVTPPGWQPEYKVRSWVPNEYYEEETDTHVYNFAKGNDDTPTSPYFPIRVPGSQLRRLIGPSPGWPYDSTRTVSSYAISIISP